MTTPKGYISKNTRKKIDYINTMSEEHRTSKYFIDACKEGNRHKIYRVYNKVRKIEDDKKLEQNLTPDQWAEELKDVTDDRERFDRFGTLEFKDAAPTLYNVWNFKKPDTRLGSGGDGGRNFYPGQIPLNVLYYYSKPGDTVVHYYNSETNRKCVENACKIMGRKYVGYRYPSPWYVEEEEGK